LDLSLGRCPTANALLGETEKVSAPNAAPGKGAGWSASDHLAGPASTTIRHHPLNLF